MSFLEGLHKLKRMARSSPGNAVVLAYAKRLEREAGSFNELRLVDRVFRDCGLEILEMTIPAGAVVDPFGDHHYFGTHRLRYGVEWINKPPESSSIFTTEIII